MKSIAAMTMAELAAFVQSCLRTRGIDVVLSGGACVSIYSRNRYVSMDLDLINTRFIRPRWSDLRSAMQEIGFADEGGHFAHTDTEILVEFPEGPLSVGEEPVKVIDELRLSTGTLRIISPTDCVKDRLTWYYHDNDRQCLEQAVWVAQEKSTDVREVERWSRAEGKLKEFQRIKSRLLGRP